ncbi:MAG TPA: hypothetical protein VMR31_00110 [Myxococcota bacterium]|nr:hypothetical protein [Myxococcota bacterium]
MLRRVAALALCGAAALGCANHVRFDDEVREYESREVTAAYTRIDAPAPVAASPALDLVVSIDETVRVRRRETLVHLDEETPWRAQNELWEVPAGLVAVPFFVGVKASNKLCLGLIPNDFIEGGLDWSFAALNPAMNVESPTRVRGVEVSRKTRELGSETDRATRPLAGVPVAVSLDRSSHATLPTDPDGRVRVDLLALLGVPVDPTPRSVRVEVAGAAPRSGASLELPLSGRMRERLAAGARERAAALTPGASAERAARAVEALGALGFRDSALALERELRARQQADAAWLSRLDLALSE